MRLLMENGCDVNMRDAQGKAVMHHVAAAGYKDMVIQVYSINDKEYRA